LSEGCHDLLELVAKQRRQDERGRLREDESRQLVEAEEPGDDAWNESMRDTDVDQEWTQHGVHVTVGEEHAVHKERSATAYDCPRHHFPRDRLGIADLKNGVFWV